MIPSQRATDSFRKKLAASILVTAFLLLTGIALAAEVPAAERVDVPGTTGAKELPQAAGWAFLAAALAVGLGSVGAGVAVGYVGAAALGVIAEKPEMAGRAFVFVGLAEGIAIYGLVVALMILRRIG